MFHNENNKILCIRWLYMDELSSSSQQSPDRGPIMIISIYQMRKPRHPAVQTRLQNQSQNLNPSDRVPQPQDLLVGESTLWGPQEEAWVQVKVLCASRTEGAGRGAVTRRRCVWQRD